MNTLYLYFLLILITIFIILNIKIFNKKLLDLSIIFSEILIINIINYYNVSYLILFYPITLSLFYKNNKSFLINIILTILFMITKTNINYVYILIFIGLIYLIKKLNINNNKKIIFYNISFILFYILINGLELSIIYYLIFTLISIIYLDKINNKINYIKDLKNKNNKDQYNTSIFKVTHEIKNPLAVIKGYLSIYNPYDINKSIKYKDIITKEVDNALLVLKDFSEINHLCINKNNINFNNLISDVKDSILPYCETKHLKCNINIENNLIIYADYQRLKQVLINILKNSYEAIDNYGIIDIVAYKNNNNLIIKIKDNGCGISNEDLKEIFTPFYTKKSFGSGLGLCLSKEIIERHGGSIKYFSKLNMYTLVRIEIPT